MLVLLPENSTGINIDTIQGNDLKPRFIDLILSKIKLRNCYIVLFFIFTLYSCDIRQSTVFNSLYGGHFQQRIFLNSLRQEFFEHELDVDSVKFRKAIDSIQVNLEKLEMEVANHPMLPNSISNVHFLLEDNFYYLVEFDFLNLGDLNVAMEIIKLIKRKIQKIYFPEEEAELDFTRQTFTLDNQNNFIIQYKQSLRVDTTSIEENLLMKDDSNVFFSESSNPVLIYDEFIPNKLLGSEEKEILQQNKSNQKESEDIFSSMSIKIFQEWTFPQEIHKIKIKPEIKNLLQYKGSRLWMNIDDRTLEEIQNIKEIRATIIFK